MSLARVIGVFAVAVWLCCGPGVLGQDRAPASKSAAQQHQDSPAWQRYRNRRKGLSKAITEARSLIHRGDVSSLRQAAAMLRRCESKLGLSPDRRGDPMIEGSLARIAVLAHRPRRALKVALPFVPSELSPEHYDSHLDTAVLATGRAYLQLATFNIHTKRRTGAWSPAKAEPVFAHVQLDPDTHKPRLTAEARDNAQKAATLFDQLAGVSYNGGETQARAATGCGEALMLLGEYDRGIESLKFALHFGRKIFRAADDSSKAGPFLIYIERTLDSARRLQDISQYSKEYVLYRDAESLRRHHHKYKDAAKKYLACIAAGRETMRRLAAAKAVVDPVAGAAGPKSDEASPVVRESPFAAASKLYLAQCLIQLGDDGQAIARLKTFIEDDDAKHPKLYRGEALLTLGRVALNHRLDLDQAGKYFAQADAWIDRARKENQDWDFGKLLPGIRAAAKKLTDAPKHETTTDFWGNINRHPIKPGQLVNRKTCTWYLDDLQAQCAAYRGFVALTRGRRKQAAKQFERILQLQPRIAKAQRGHVPNNYSRLMAGVKNGYLIAEPQELKLYNDRQKQYILLGDFYYVTQHFRDSIAIFQAFLRKQANQLTSAQRDYAHFAIGLSLYRGHWSDAATTQGEVIKQFEEVLKHHDGTWTEFKAGVAAANILCESHDAQIRAKGLAIYRQLIASGRQNRFAYIARINLANQLIRSKSIREGMTLLKEMPRSAGSYYTIAQYELSEYEKKYGPLERSTQ